MDLCYNCNGSNHHSRNCPFPQRLTRCPVCNNVCERREKHRGWCTNLDFLSQPRSHVAVPLETITKIGFNSVSDVKVMDLDGEKEVTSDPLFIANANIIVSKIDKRLVCVSPQRIEASHINIVGNHNNTLMHVEIGKDFVKVNNRYQIDHLGSVRYNIMNGGCARDMGKLRIKVNHTDIFSIRLYMPYGTFELVACGNGVMFVDPLKAILEANDGNQSYDDRDAENDDGGNDYESNNGK